MLYTRKDLSKPDITSILGRANRVEWIRKRNERTRRRDGLYRRGNLVTGAEQSVILSQDYDVVNHVRVEFLQYIMLERSPVL